MFPMRILVLATFLLLFLSGCSLPQKSISKILWSATGTADPYEIGSVDTAFQRIGPDHQIEVWAVPDPKIEGITCFYSRAKAGGIQGWLGLATDTSDASVSCRQTGVIRFKEAIAKSEEIWNESASIFFKKLRIVRFYDQKSNSLIYLVYSDKLIDGSPKNSISAVALESVVALIQ
jgi:CreA protein